MNQGKEGGACHDVMEEADGAPFTPEHLARLDCVMEARSQRSEDCPGTSGAAGVALVTAASQC